MFKVLFKGRGEASPAEWKPNEEDDYVVEAATARDRFRRLVQAGQRGNEVDGVVPWYVALVDVSRPDKSESVKDVSRVDEPIAPDKRVRLVQYAEKGTKAQGAWADQAAAS